MESGFRNAETFLIVENNPVGKFNVRFIIRIIRYSFCLLKNYQLKYNACGYSHLSLHLAVETVNRFP